MWIGLKAPANVLDGTVVALGDGTRVTVTNGSAIAKDARDIASLMSAGYTVGGSSIEMPALFSGKVTRGADGAVLSVVAPSTGGPSVLHTSAGTTVANTPAGLASLAAGVSLLSPVWVTLQGPISAAGRVYTWPSGDQSTVDPAGLVLAPADAANGMTAQGFVRANT